MALILVGITGHAMAVPKLKMVHTFHQESETDKIYARVLVEAESDWALLQVDGEFTIQCGTSHIKLMSSARDTHYNLLGPELILNPGGSGQHSHSIPNWSSIPAGTCGGAGQCVMYYKGEARDKVAEASVPGMEDFDLGADGEISVEDNVSIEICKGDEMHEPQTSPPGCEMPSKEQP